MKRASYKKGVEWIALNDDPAANDARILGVVMGYVSVSLLADLFDVTTVQVAADVVAYREKLNYKPEDEG